MKILFFAWLKTKAGVAEAEVTPPADVTDVARLIEWLRPTYGAAFADPAVLRVAVNHDHVGLDHPVKPGDEVAFFPPVTGG